MQNHRPCFLLGSALFLIQAACSSSPAASTTSSGASSGSGGAASSSGVGGSGGGATSSSSSAGTSGSTSAGTGGAGGGGADLPVKVAAGGMHTCALMKSGKVKCWGDNESGQLGDGTNTSSSDPVEVLGLSDAVDVAGGYYHTCAIRKGGGLACWGHGYLGELGDGKATDTPKPVDVPGIKAATHVAAGTYATCVVDGGAAKCWGEQSIGGQLGDGMTGKQVNTPEQVLGLASGVSDVDLWFTYTGCAVAGNALSCWGLSYAPTPAPVSGFPGAPILERGGFLLTSTGVYSLLDPKFPEVPGLGGITSLSVNFTNRCAIVSGAGKCWGNNDAGQIGDGTKTKSDTPVQVTGLTSGVTSISTGLDQSCAIQNSVVKCWGESTTGETGQPAGTESLTPVVVQGL